MNLTLKTCLNTISLGLMLLISSNIALGGQSMNPDILAKSKTQQKLWLSQNINHYQYTYNRICYCPPPANTPMKISVKNKKIISVINTATNQAIENPDPATYKSIDQLFEVIADAVKRNPDEIQVTYDPKFGYPTRIFIDYLKLAADDEMTYTASDLVIKNN